ncbi:tRNA (N6-threonylcarbamoyladenosine(37)-N6)-methyltransferase TrmO [Amycolatopsis sp. FDAARGOS 1241]|uniref:tRNA (N6-threonylcarbamoyladenosine(37)-N6)-methyltransferase TrmO n=1 Tax=Amycolatopsis sp. FDAARGOS 1241 TaxID=2778070 RepID=UPI0019507779|nr:tRNA (N6-threonylcarbamoyladenosine(37)-N6)-methyltransferase TrmO [Amycolatopsis sp. FDAARGOS 1241]QRP45728.1 tRNA (N6-threonylcarbamoyladenosine(37)-N6)-methyltransferase TrmO [Amycolatopsis sp. FDAARGOS 1241]
MADFQLRPIARVQSTLDSLDSAPKQGEEGAPSAWLVFEPEVAEGLADLRTGQQVLLFTWLHLADRSVLSVRPRSDPSRPPAGVFSTRSPARPNPIGLHRVEVLEIDGLRVRVGPLEAVDGTPVIDVKPARSPGDG